jgi:murein DD-endopeptidase MepM/ murein hydrolase activator NlpD
MVKDRNTGKKNWISRLRNKYRLVFMNDETLEERFTFRLSRLNVFIALGTMTIILIFLTSILIAFTPLREYIPGYTNVGIQKRLYELQIKTDSIERDLSKKDLFIKNLKDIINGRDLPSEVAVNIKEQQKYGEIRIKKSVEDSLLRLEIENQNKYSITRSGSSDMAFGQNKVIGNILFFTPMKGVITNEFNPAGKHFGVDLVAKQDEAIKAVLDGTVILSDWTLETGYVIVLQHKQNLISVYKHNSALLKKCGEFVKAGDPIAIIGETGELTSGPHLHFELWNDGNPVDPKEYITF